MHFVVTGCGRSGTGYVSLLLTRLGIPTGHERVFLPDERRPWRPYTGDSSCFAVPFLRELAGSVPIIHLVRDPLAVGRSYSHRRLFHCGPKDIYAQAFYDYDRAPWDPLEPVDRFSMFWIRWNLAVEAVATARFRIEDLRRAEEVDRLMRAIGHQLPDSGLDRILGAIDLTDPRYNTKPRDEAFELDVSPTIQPVLEQSAARYGYAI